MTSLCSDLLGDQNANGTSTTDPQELTVCVASSSSIDAINPDLSNTDAKGNYMQSRYSKGTPECEWLRAPDLSIQELGELATRIEEVLTKARDNLPLLELSDIISGALDAQVQAAPRELSDAIYGENGNGSLSRAFTIGHLSFAHLIVEQTSARRAGDFFCGAFKNDRYKKYIEFLVRDDLSNVRLAELVDERPETVSRKMKELRELGVTGFRRVGTQAINFLTPASRSAAMYVEEHEEEVGVGVSELLKQKMAGMPDYMKSLQLL